MDLRPEWKAFKSKYPEVEKNKVVQLNLGPALEKCADALARGDKAVEDAKKAYKEAFQLAINAMGSINQYNSQVIKKLNPPNPQLSKDFMNLRVKIEALEKTATERKSKVE